MILELAKESRIFQISIVTIILALILVAGFVILTGDSHRGDHLVDYPETEFEHTIQEHEIFSDIWVVNMDENNADELRVYIDDDEPIVLDADNKIEFEIDEGDTATFVSSLDGDREVIGTVSL